MAYFDENGNEVKGLLTEDEMKERMQEETKTLMEEAAKAKADAEAAMTKHQEEVTTLRQQIDAAKAEPAGGAGQQSQSDKDENLAALRKKLEETEATIAQERQATAERIAALEGDKVAQAIAAVAGDNPELAEKIKHNYEHTLSGVKAVTAAEIAEKVQNAVKLSTNATAPNPLDIAVPGGASPTGTRAPQSGQKTEFKPTEVEIGSKMGISDADRAKYGSDPRLNSMNTK